MATPTAQSPDFPFVLKGRSDDCQPQSSDLDLGGMFALAAGYLLFTPLTNTEGENHHCKDKSLPSHWHFAFPIPQAVLLEFFLS